MRKISLIKNKKAQMFTLVAIALILLMFLSVDVYSYMRQKEVIKNRVKSMDSFMAALENNLERQAQISGFRILFLGISRTSQTGEYLTNFNSFVNEAFFSGTVNGAPEFLMIGATRDALIESVREKALKINANVTMENTQINITQKDPWTVKIVISSDFVLKDLQGLAEWRKRQNITSYVSIEGFEDPLYIKSTVGKLGAPIKNEKIKKTPYDGEYCVGGDRSNLSDHYRGGYYAPNPNAPSFLNRLQGNLSANENGIESFVITDELEAQRVATDKFDDIPYDETRIDYLYFNETANVPGVTVAPLTSAFRIDVAHGPKYNLSI